jgi:hypothetical protein
MRDDFSKPVADTLARRVGNQCSNPGCGKSTSAPHTEHHKAINIGVAAHITAASPGGARYDASLSSEQRSAIDNGIWLCQNCAKLIDNDEIQFPTHMIREWRQRAEDRRTQEVSGRHNEPKQIVAAVVAHNPADRPAIPHDPFEARPAEPNKKPMRVPPLEQMSGLVKALEQFVWHDGGSFNPIPWAQEQHRLPGFICVADAIAPLRGNVLCEGWPGWMPALIESIITIFDTIAHAWGWGAILKTETERLAYMKDCEDNFNKTYLIPIQDAARRCYGNFSVVDRPHWLEELIENLPPIGFDFLFLGTTEAQLQPFLLPLRAKRNALMYGINYPTLSDFGDDDSSEEFSAEVALAGMLGQATHKLALAVKNA